MKNKIKVFNNYFFYLILYATLLFAVLIKYYLYNHIILGGEGDYFIDFSMHLENFGYTWQNAGTGFFTTSLNANFVNIIFLVILQKIFQSDILINFILIFLIYFLPFFAIFIICMELKITPFISFCISFFYIINPFNLYYLTALNQWNTSSLFVIPMFFWVIMKFYNNNIKLFFYFGLTSLLFAFANANPPLMVIHQISIMFSVIIISYYFNSSVSLNQIIKKYILLITSFILFNFWWISNWVNVLVDAQKMYSTEFALSWLSTGQFEPIIWKIFTLNYLFPADKSYNFLSIYYNTYLSIFLSLIPILIICYFFCIWKSPKKYLLVLTVMLLTIFFFIKGVHEPFGNIYGYMVLNIPFFNIFKTPAEKWGILYIFSFTLLLAFIFVELKKTKDYYYIVSVFIIYLVFVSIPFFTSNFIPDYKIGDVGFGSREFYDKPEYKYLRNELNNDTVEYRVLSLPGNLNYQVMLHMYDNKYYTGMDPVLNNINKPFIAAYSNNVLANYDILFNNISSSNYIKILGYYNVKKIVINKDMYPWFGFKERENVSRLEEIFDKNMVSKKEGSIIVYDNNDNFLPRIYGSTIPTLINGSLEDMFRVITLNNFTAENNIIFLSNQTNDTQWRFLEGLNYTNSSPPIITFQKINPTKYTVKVENASQPFFLILSDSFHQQWKAYINGETYNTDSIVISKYDHIKVNEAKINNNWIYTPRDIFYLFSEPISELKHFKVNGYANAWFIDQNELTKRDFTITLYYRPQILFYFWLIISGTILLGCIVYVICWRKYEIS